MDHNCTSNFLPYYSGIVYIDYRKIRKQLHMNCIQNKIKYLVEY